MFNYLIKIEYDGTEFVGWQSQKNGKTVQDTIELALKKVLRSKIKIIGAGELIKVFMLSTVVILNIKRK